MSALEVITVLTADSGCLCILWKILFLTLTYIHAAIPQEKMMFSRNTSSLWNMI